MSTSLEDLLTHSFRLSSSPVSIRVIDPLSRRLFEVLKRAEPHPVQASVNLFGDEEDLRRIASSIDSLRGTRSSEPELWLIDLTVVGSFSSSRAVQLPELFGQCPVLILARQNGTYLDLIDAGVTDSISVGLCDEKGYIISLENESLLEASHADLVSDWIGCSQRVQQLRLAGFHEALLSYLRAKGIRYPPKGKAFWGMRNAMCTNLYVDVKAMLRNPEFAAFCAYCMAYGLTAGFTELTPGMALMAVNNTAVFLATILQLMLDMDLFVIDHLGPVVSLREPRYGSLPNFGGKDIWLVEEVVATGREADLASLLVSLRGGYPRGVVCLYDLESGHPLWPSALQKFIALCKPSKSIGYKYSSCPEDTRSVQPI